MPLTRRRGASMRIWLCSVIVSCCALSTPGTLRLLDEAANCSSCRSMLSCTSRNREKRGTYGKRHVRYLNPSRTIEYSSGRTSIRPLWNQSKSCSTNDGRTTKRRCAKSSACLRCDTYRRFRDRDGNKRRVRRLRLGWRPCLCRR